MIELLISPLCWVWLALLWLAWRGWRARNRLQSFVAFAAALTLSAFAGTPLSAYLLAKLERPHLHRQTDPDLTRVPKADVIVVLGGGQTTSPLEINRLHTTRSDDRTLAALELLRRGASTNVALGGGSVLINNKETLVAEAVDRWLRLYAPSNSAIYQLPFNRNTHDEATHTRELARAKGWSTVLLVTSGSHLTRSTATFERAGLKVIPWGCDFQGLSALQNKNETLWTIIPEAKQLLAIDSAMHEYVGMAYYRLRGWL
jgi:uncharacterized SAM-binding protein YcdF (DUF218 family)